MNNKVTKTAYIYTFEWYVDNDGNMDEDAALYMQFHELNSADSVMVDMRPVEVAIPPAVVMKQRKLESLEQQLAKIKADAVSSIQDLTGKIEALKALEHLDD